MFDIKKSLGKRIRELRTDRNWTQEVFAEKIGIEISSLSNLENGKNFPSADSIEKISSALNILPNELFIFEHLELPSANVLINEMNEAFEKDKDLVYRIYNVFKVIKTKT